MINQHSNIFTNLLSKMVSLRDYQANALRQMHNGCILNGGVGSGKSRTSIAYYYKEYGGKIYYFKKNQETREFDIGPFDYDTGQRVAEGTYKKMVNPPDLYIITTARKRDTLEWEQELLPFMISKDGNFYQHKVVIDSWSNIEKYSDVSDAFFIFDEQKVSGFGKWAKTFIKIAKTNKWVLLTATPGDTWEDYKSVFIANGYFKNQSDFNRKHVVFNQYVKNYPKIDHYVCTGALQKMRKSLLIMMDFDRTEIERHHEHIICEYDLEKYKIIENDYWDIFNNSPLENPTDYCYCLRRIVNSSEDRIRQIINILKIHPKAIIFYNFDYELFALEKALQKINSVV